MTEATLKAMKVKGTQTFNGLWIVRRNSRAQFVFGELGGDWLYYGDAADIAQRGNLKIKSGEIR